MENNEKNNDLTQEILHGLEKAYQELVKFKRYKNSPLVVEKNGVIIEIPPDEIPPTTIYKRDIEGSTKEETIKSAPPGQQGADF